MKKVISFVFAIVFTFTCLVGVVSAFQFSPNPEVYTKLSLGEEAYSLKYLDIYKDTARTQLLTRTFPCEQVTVTMEISNVAYIVYTDFFGVTYQGYIEANNIIKAEKVKMYAKDTVRLFTFGFVDEKIFIPRGATVQVLSPERIEYNGLICYMVSFNNHIGYAPATEFSTNQKYEAQTKTMRVSAEIAPLVQDLWTCKELDILRKGEEITVYGFIYDGLGEPWYLTEYYGCVGYICGRLLEEI